MKKVSVKLNERPHQYRVTVGHDLLKDCGGWAEKSLGRKGGKVAVISNPKVFGLYGKKVEKSLRDNGFDVFVWLMGDGEQFKNLGSLETALSFFSRNKLTRTDSVLALGGGVVGDLAGFAASVYLRGISFLQIPTTLLAMIDSSVGGKTAVNTEFGKNLIGTFFQPAGVLVDIGVLETLERRELTAGFCEAVKQGAISGPRLFDQTGEFLENYSPERFENFFSDEKFLSKLEKLLAAQIGFKAEIVMQDEREEASRMDAKSRKILNFGHTLAHALEKVTEYKYFKHGEAVGYGIRFAGELSKILEIFDQNRLKLLNDVVSRAGVLPETDDIKIEKVFQAFSFDKKIVNESLQWILLKDIGEPFIRRNSEVPKSAIELALKKTLQTKTDSNN
ncbi:MAG: 3-dehydroquinate synthase [Pyrinomonadaceae bacterium]